MRVGTFLPRMRGKLKRAYERKEAIMGNSNRFASADFTAGQLSTDELSVSELVRSWCEVDGIIYFSVTSDGTTGKDWITRLESKGSRVGDYAKQVLRSPSFKPTSGVTTDVAVLRGCFFEDNNRTTKKIRAYAKAFRTPDNRKLGKPEPELACLIREKFTDDELEAMGLWYIIAMHESIITPNGKPRFLGVYRGDGGSWIYACCNESDKVWNRAGGSAFVVSHASTES
ncbi:MAG: hypothetical protein UW78_C0001G0018 [Candidatus Azambacteria bacterium GW2011_GWA1_44_9]|uniref:Uncharacterized protein n=2 Tax=Parcubacteria group TaxID=1794811 RepID=A0A0G1KFF9_9BACT|nr:MAG: hypothetical protein UW78_C0001G0018 [Candidatus Azambacteria bacterium GW2011_GWA1_44_9]